MVAQGIWIMEPTFYNDIVFSYAWLFIDVTLHVWRGTMEPVLNSYIYVMQTNNCVFLENTLYSTALKFN